MTLVVGLGPGDPQAVPAAALAAIAPPARVFAPPLDPGLLAVLAPVVPEALPPIDALPPGAVVAAPDPDAHDLARALPAARTLPDRESLRGRAIGARVARLAGVGLRLRRDCPWDREQDAASIVPHTIEEAFEVADAVASGDPARQADEIGDLLFQAVFLAQLLEETGDADLGTVADGQADKLIGRHPHVYGDAVARDAARVLDMWERRKREERAEQGIFHDLPAGLPALAYATKAQKRAAAVGFAFGRLEDALAQLREEVGELTADPVPEELGDVLFAAVTVGRFLGADPELALRGTAQRFRGRVERAAELAADAGERFEELDPERQLEWYVRGRFSG